MKYSQDKIRQVQEQSLKEMEVKIKWLEHKMNEKNKNI